MRRIGRAVPSHGDHVPHTARDGPRPRGAVAGVLHRLGFLSDVPSEAWIVAEVHRIHRRRARMVVARFSRGNAHLARGLYVTRDDIDAALGLGPGTSSPRRPGPGAG